MRVSDRDHDRRYLSPVERHTRGGTAIGRVPMSGKNPMGSNVAAGFACRHETVDMETGARMD